MLWNDGNFDMEDETGDTVVAHESDQDVEFHADDAIL